MANLQYIGARYVPKFYLNPDYPAPDQRNNDWKSGVDYEALTIVTYNNDSYTSKKTVPAEIGNPADNVEYWACTTKYTAAIMALQTEVGDLDHRVDNIEDLIGNTPLDTEAQKLTDAINELNAPIVIDRLAQSLKNTVNSGINFVNNTMIRIGGYTATLVNNTGYIDMQGAAYNSKNNTFITSFLEGSKCMLVEVDATDFTTVLNRATFVNDELGHANDITYNPRTNKYYITTVSGASVQANRLAVLDADNLTLEGYTTLNPATSGGYVNCAWNVAYNNETDQYICISHDKIQLYDKDFVLLSESDYNAEQYVKSTGLLPSQSLSQCCEVFDNRVIVVNFGHNNNSISVDFCTFSIFDYNTGEMVSSYPIRLDCQGDEVEGIFTIDGVIYLIMYSGTRDYIVKKVVPQTMSSVSLGNDFFGCGIAIPSGADLDNYIIPGKYLVKDGTIAATLSNSYEMSSGFVMFVFNSLGGYLTQLILRQYENGINPVGIGVRTYVNSTRTFTRWKAIGDGAQLTSNQLVYSNVVVPAYITDGSKEIVFSLPWKNCQAQTASYLSFNAGRFTGRYDGDYIKDIDNTGRTDVDLTSKSCTIEVGLQGYTVHVRNSDASAWQLKNNTTVTNNASFNLMLSSVDLRYTVP